FEVPGDGLPLAVGVGGEEDAARFARLAAQFGERLALPLLLDHLVAGDPAGLDADADDLLVGAFVFFPFALGEVAHVALAGEDLLCRAELFTDGLCLGRRLDNHEIKRAAPARAVAPTICFRRRPFLARRGLGSRRANGGGLLAAGRGSLGVTRLLLARR